MFCVKLEIYIMHNGAKEIFFSIGKRTSVSNVYIISYCDTIENCEIKYLFIKWWKKYY